MQMLLSFPLDPTPSVMEIISDSIYANSSTLDGRRFTADFCTRRKQDAANGQGIGRSNSGASGGGGGGAKVLSLADGMNIFSICQVRP